VIEAGLGDLINKGVAAGRITATTDAAVAVAETDVSIICVGTPSNANGSLDLSQVEKVASELGENLVGKKDHVVVVRSTMLPGSTETLVIPAIERASGKRAGVDFGVCFNPEFLREGSSLRDFFDPPFTLIGSADDRAAEAVRRLYSSVEGQVFVVPIKAAEMVKYASNAFHALKVTFANEIGTICKQQGIDSHEVMRLFNEDTKLNISTAYLMPGFAFGGSCLPKDLRALIYHARSLDVETPVLESVMTSNRAHVERALQMVQDTQRKRIGVLGFSFKAGTDDLRESPTVELIERLIGKGYTVNVYDRNVSLANLQGANRAYIEREIPHIASLMSDTVIDVINASEVIVIGNASPEFRAALDLVRPDHAIIDLVRVTEEQPSNANYAGICW
jgi:GDP-mannose 6-dehydrogenase